MDGWNVGVSITNQTNAAVRLSCAKEHEKEPGGFWQLRRMNPNPLVWPSGEGPRRTRRLPGSWRCFHLAEDLCKASYESSYRTGCVALPLLSHEHLILLYLSLFLIKISSNQTAGNRHYLKYSRSSHSSVDVLISNNRIEPFRKSLGRTWFKMEAGCSEQQGLILDTSLFSLLVLANSK